MVCEKPYKMDTECTMRSLNTQVRGWTLETGQQSTTVDVDIVDADGRRVDVRDRGRWIFNITQSRKQENQ